MPEPTPANARVPAAGPTPLVCMFPLYLNEPAASPETPVTEPSRAERAPAGRDSAA